MKSVTLWAWIVTCVFVAVADSAASQDLDTSKPTNLYSFLENNLEYTVQDSVTNVYGYRGTINYAPAASVLIVGEVPILYNDQTEDGGLGDVRARAFWIAYKDYSQFFGAFGPSLDVFAPTGSFEDGLGSSRWTISPGVTVGLMLADWIQAFPILSYQYVSKSTSELVPDVIDEDRNGLTIQSITPIVFSPKFFMQVTPIYSIPNFSDSSESGFQLEVNGVYAFAAKLQASAFLRRDFKQDVTVARVSLSIFF